jgi:hypothetical protein
MMNFISYYQRFYWTFFAGILLATFLSMLSVPFFLEDLKVSVVSDVMKFLYVVFEMDSQINRALFCFFKVYLLMELMQKFYFFFRILFFLVCILLKNVCVIPVTFLN